MCGGGGCGVCGGLRLSVGWRGGVVCMLCGVVCVLYVGGVGECLWGVLCGGSELCFVLFVCCVLSCICVVLCSVCAVCCVVYVRCVV